MCSSDAATYDSATDGIVRVSVNRLRDLLDRYYGDEGAHAALRFEIQRGVYVPIIRRATPPGLPPLPRINVLPLANFTGYPDFDPLCDGLTEDIIDAMTRVPDTRIIARTSSFRFKGQALDVRDIAQALNVDALLEGSVQQVGVRLRVTAQLVLGSDGSHTVASHKPPSTLSSTCACLSRAAGRIRVRFSNTRWRSRTVSCRSSCSCLRIRYSIVITPIRAGCNC